jgi:hypothetical protein
MSHALAIALAMVGVVAFGAFCSIVYCAVRVGHGYNRGVDR